jgi:hypothetical protein
MSHLFLSRTIEDGNARAGSATSFVQRTGPTTNVTVSSGHVAGSGGDEFVLSVEASRSNTSLYAVFIPGFFFDCQLYSNASDRHGVQSVAGTYLPVCGHISQYPSTIFARNLVTAQPAGQGQGILTVVCPQGSACGGLDSPIPALPPHGFAVPLRNGAVTLTGLGPRAAAPGGEGRAQPPSGGSSPPSPTWRTAAEVQGIIARRLDEVSADLDRGYPRSEVGQMRDGVEAIRTVIGWNTVWDQRVKVITPVSRTFGVNPWIMW